MAFETNIPSNAGCESSTVDFSLIVPAFNEQGNIAPFFEAATAAFESFDGTWELIFVDDGSTDATLGELKALAAKDNLPCSIQAISFSRNFGKEAALFAGLQHARGDFLGFIDADLQQDPAISLQMLRELRGNDEYDCVAAYQQQRQGGAFKNWCARRYYRMLNRSTGLPVVADASDFRVFRRTVAQALLDMPEYYRFSKGMFSWIGFKTLPFPYTPDERANGKSSWSFGKLVRYGLDGLLSFTTVPLKLASWVGVLTFIAAFIYLVTVIVRRLMFGIDVPGYASIVVLLLFFGGLQLFVLGILGEYLARAYIQGKNRPLYITREVITSHPEGRTESDS